MTAAQSNLDAALSYAAQGLPVFPCIPCGKEPAVKGGFHAATTNPATIERYWRIADRNIGIATGPASGLWVLDVDGDDGAASLLSLEAVHGKLPATRESTTGRGRHLWFKYTGPVSNSAGRVAAAIDVRGDGGYVIVPPSVHPNGRRYEFVSCDQLATAPQWLERLARTKKVSERAIETIKPGAGFQTTRGEAYGNAALDAEIANLAATRPGTRNVALNCTAFKLFQLVAGGELDEGEVIGRLIAASYRNGLVKDDGFASVLATIGSARAGLKFPRSRSGGT